MGQVTQEIQLETTCDFSLKWKAQQKLDKNKNFEFFFFPWARAQSCSASWVTQSCLTLRPHGLQHARLPCPSPTPGACSNSHPSSQWCHPTISSSAVSFSSCLQSFPASGSYSNESVLQGPHYSIKWSLGLIKFFSHCDSCTSEWIAPTPSHLNKASDPKTWSVLVSGWLLLLLFTHCIVFSNGKHSVKLEITK